MERNIVNLIGLDIGTTSICGVLYSSKENKTVKKITSITFGVVLLLLTVILVKYLPAFLKIMIIGINILYFYYYVYLEFKKLKEDE